MNTLYIILQCIFCTMRVSAKWARTRDSSLFSINMEPLTLACNMFL